MNIQNNVLIDWRTLRLDNSIDVALSLLATLCDEHYGRFEINDVSNRDHGEYPPEHYDRYEVELWADEYKYSGKGHDNILSIAVMKTVIAFLQDIENEPLEYENTLNALRMIDDATLRGLMEQFITDKLSPTRSRYSKFDIFVEIRKRGGK